MPHALHPYSCDFCAFDRYSQCLHHLLSIDEAASHLNDSLPLIQSFHTLVRQQLSTLLQSITTILDLHTDHPTHLNIQPDIDTRLDTLKHNRTQLPYLLAQLVAEDADYGGELEGWQFVYVYMQQVGFLVRMRSGGEEARWEDGDWLFDDDGYDFYKSERCRQLDDGQCTEPLCSNVCQSIAGRTAHTRNGSLCGCLSSRDR